MYYDDEPEIVSKSEIKRQMTALQKLGEKLLELSPKQLARVPMSDKLAEAIDTAKRINHHEGKRRQMQYIGKLMRSEDGEAIGAVIQQIEDGHKALARAFQQLENWRDRLIAEGENAIGDIAAEYPDIDRQHLRQLIRNAQREASQNKPPASARKLFKYLRETYEASLED
ncbi:MAG: ribosome-associated protein [Pseudomonadota bacterium]